MVWCNYSKEGDCKLCSYRKNCILIKPFSDELYKMEVKRIELEQQNKILSSYISNWDEIENNLDEYGVSSVLDVAYYPRSRQQMIDRINDNEKLIKAYRDKEKNMI